MKTRKAPSLDGVRDTIFDKNKITSLAIDNLSI